MADLDRNVLDRVGKYNLNDILYIKYYFNYSIYMVLAI